MANRTLSTNATAGGRPGWLAGALRIFSLRRPALSQRRGLFIAALGLRVAGAGLLVWIGIIHWLLWHDGYKFIPTSGPFFLVDAIAGVLLAVLVLAWPRPLVGLVSAGFVASTIAALLISLQFGLFGFHESTSASYVGLSLVIEPVAVLILLVWTVIAAASVPRDL